MISLNKDEDEVRIGEGTQKDSGKNIGTTDFQGFSCKELKQIVEENPDDENLKMIDYLLNDQRLIFIERFPFLMDKDKEKISIQIRTYIKNIITVITREIPILGNKNIGDYYKSIISSIIDDLLWDDELRSVTRRITDETSEKIQELLQRNISKSQNPFVINVNNNRIIKKSEKSDWEEYLVKNEEGKHIDISEEDSMIYCFEEAREGKNDTEQIYLYLILIDPENKDIKIDFEYRGIKIQKRLREFLREAMEYAINLTRYTKNIPEDLRRKISKRFARLIINSIIGKSLCKKNDDKEYPEFLKKIDEYCEGVQKTEEIILEKEKPPKLPGKYKETIVENIESIPDSNHLLLGFMEKLRKKEEDEGEEVKINRCEKQKIWIPTHRVPEKKLQKDIESREAIIHDIPEIIRIYNNLQYPRCAFKTLAELTREKYKEIRSGMYGEEPKKEVIRAIESISGGGEFSPISKNMWKDRIKNPGQRVVVLSDPETKQIIGVNSYWIGPDAQNYIDSRIGAINLNRDHGLEWERNKGVLKNGKRTYPNVIYIDDTFFDNTLQKKGLFQLSYLKMIKDEIERGNIKEGDEESWNIALFINQFKGFYPKGREEDKILYLHKISGKTKNYATLIASGKIGAEQIGTTNISKHRKVPSFQQKEKFIKIAGKPIYVDGGYIDFIIRVQDLLDYFYK